jgi:multidrug efflux pump subunit AcrB
MNGIVAWWGRNPVAGNLLMVACLILGFVSFSRMDREYFPGAQSLNLSIDAVWPGASPEDVESQLLLRIEEATAQIEGLRRVRSTANEGFGNVDLEIDPSRSGDEVFNEVRTAVDAITGLPTDLEPIRVTRQQFRQFAILFAVSSPTADERTLKEAAERARDEVALLPGAALTELWGGRAQEISIEVSEEALRRYGLTFSDVAQAARSASIDLSAGSVRTPTGDYQLRTRALMREGESFGDIVVRQTADGAVVRIRDVARVVDGFVDVNVNEFQNGEPSIIIATNAGENFDLPAVAARVRAYIANQGVVVPPDVARDPERKAAYVEANRWLPEDVRLSVVADQSGDYEGLLEILFSNAIQGFALIFVLLLLTLHPKVAFWSTAGVITAFAGSFIILPYLDISLNFMAVFGFLLVLGIMVDDAIIVGEAIYERIERGETGADAAIFATQLVLKPLMASVFVTMFAFMPWMFLTGEVQQFTRAISIVVMSTLVFSLIESLIILPAHLAKVRLPRTLADLDAEEAVTGRRASATARLNARLMGWQQVTANGVIWFAENIYGPFLRVCVRWRYATLAAFLVVMATAVGWFASGRVEQSFFPDVEGDFMQVEIEMPAGTPFSRTREVAAQVEVARAALEAETAAMAHNGSRGVIVNWYTVTSDRQIQAFITLTPPEVRDETTREIGDRFRRLLGEVPDAERISTDGGFGGGNNDLAIILYSKNVEDLRRAVEDLKTKLRGYDGTWNVSDSEDSPVQELNITLRPGAQQVGLTQAEVIRQVRQAYFGEQVQRIPRDGQDLQVWVRLPAEDRRTLDSLQSLRVRTPDGREVPLSEVADVSFSPGTTEIFRSDRQRAIVVTAEGTSERLAEIRRDLDASGFWTTFNAAHPEVNRRASGSDLAQQEFMSELSRYLLMAVLAMYGMLAVVFRSYVQPILILSAIPFCFVGAVFGHTLMGATFALFSWLGLVAAMGVVVNDNVVLIDRCNIYREEQGLDAGEGIMLAGISRFRQIFLTSITEFVGTAPLMLERSTNAQFLKPMVISLAFGVLLCMPVTLLLTACLYMIGRDIKRFVADTAGWWMSGFGRRRTPAE